MRTWVICLLAVVAVASALPRPAEDLKAQDTSAATSSSSDAARPKRTIGFLRSYFPTISELLDRKIQTITRFLFRLIGRLVLGGGGGGDDGGAAGGTSATSSGGASSSSASGGKGRRISITLPTYPPGLDDEDEEDEDEDNDTAASANDVLSSAASEPKAAQAQPPSGDEVKSRVARAVDADQKASASETSESSATKDQDAAASEDDENRDKRFLFSFGRQAEEGGQGSGGGSGNFLFDIIRNTASRTARAAGGFYRMVAGTGEETAAAAPIKYSPWLKNKGDADDDEEQEAAASGLTLGLGVGFGGKASLIAGSGASDDDHGSSGPSAPTGYGPHLGPGYVHGAAAALAEAPEVDAKEDGYTSGIPGPITRLFVIANRGVSNLIQDLILRLAQTSERIVNFKARLITSII